MMSSIRASRASLIHEASERRGYLGRLRERRAVEGTRLGVEPKPIRVSPANAAPATPLVPANATSSFD
eukprot:924990-Prymnesium_polylepis.1